MSVEFLFLTKHKLVHINETIRASVAKFSGHVEAVDAAEGGEEADVGRHEDERGHPRVEQTDPGSRTHHLVTRFK